MRGYFAIGIDGVSKAGNMGNLIRTAHGFGAAFAFAIRPDYKPPQAAPIPANRANADDHEAAGARAGRNPLPADQAKRFADTSRVADTVPYYEYDGLDALVLPRGCRLVGVEITDDAVAMPSFHHPPKAAYILGSERVDLSPALLARCDHVIKIPTQFSLNVATAGAIVMYDRLIAHGRFAERPLMPGGPAEPLPAHVHGRPKQRKQKRGQA
ncbi:rRNA methyltransferase [Rhodothalassium salexigens]|uniref:TrmH family RNA methyltransferase n=1 Tax=Rhodothalassium salexigens TaxID=1086 RepID=UPI0019114BAA|nr:TrmH family RNA methyltransferase [Rhodothalassium salexigens]MBK5912146.1 rRNA methyltransferase [Rhodothalassium salexigens]MBK5921826.1 rRNA methyltransferase [Rhodothalassium salexigens]